MSHAAVQAPVPHRIPGPQPAPLMQLAVQSPPPLQSMPLAHAPLALVWASDAREAPRVIAALERASVRVMAFAQSEPPDPMIDVLRARLR